MESIQGVRNWFWNENFWLPPNTTWHDLNRNETIFIPDAADLWIPFPIALCICLLRFIWESAFALPIGRYFNLKELSAKRPKHNDDLESAFSKNRQLPSHAKLLEYSKKLDWTIRQVERWWRRRRVAGQPTEMRKFRETSWRFIYYLTVFWYGLYILWDKEWLWDTKHCWYGYPKQHVPSEVWYYYMVSLGFYWSLVFSLFMDVKRKDFTEQLVHHFATITLMVLSWSNNMVRVGTLVLCVHDAVDYWMEGAKIAKYLKYHRLCDGLFIVFTAVWFITRICLYPMRIIRSTLVEGHTIVGFFPMYYVYNFLLMILQVLHIIWFIMICRLVHEFVVTGKVQKDERSETEPSSSDEQETTKDMHHTKNGKINSANGVIYDDHLLLAANNNTKSRPNGKVG